MGPTGYTGGSPTILYGTASIPFGATGTFETVFVDTTINKTTYTRMWLGGFSNQGTSTGVQIGGVFFDNYTGSTWLAGMGAVNPAGDDFIVYYYYL
jgi:hypothetical protein